MDSRGHAGLVGDQRTKSSERVGALNESHELALPIVSPQVALLAGWTLT